MHSHRERDETDEGIALGPKADIGILLVHGIGDHQEGQTLTAFGEPLLEWLDQWSMGNEKSPRFRMEVAETRLQANGSPAYTIVDVSKQDVSSDQQSNGREKLFLCEGWWGGVVQAPLLFCLTISRQPDIFTLNTIYKLLGGTMTGLLQGLALLFAVVGPQAFADKVRELYPAKSGAPESGASDGDVTFAVKLQRIGAKLQRFSDRELNLMITFFAIIGLPLGCTIAAWKCWPGPVALSVQGSTTAVILLTAFGAWSRLLWQWLTKKTMTADSAPSALSPSV